MKILLTGRDGQAGRELARALPALGEVVATDRAALDLADLDAIRRVTREVRPDVIVNAAAYTAVDKAESEPGLAMRVNAEAPGVLAEEAKRLDALLVHFSTDYVFDGGKPTPYAETDPANPLNSYGRSKLAGEQAILAAGCRRLILRTSWVYAPRGRNFFLTIARKAEAGERLRVVDDQVGVPTSAAFLARATVAALQENRGQTTVYHVVPDGETSWCGFARAIVARVAPGCEVAAIRSSEYPQAARRPARAVLDNRLARAEIGLPSLSWESLLDDCVAAWRGNRGQTTVFNTKPWSDPGFP